MREAAIGQLAPGFLHPVGVHEVVEVLPAARVDDPGQQRRVGAQPVGQLREGELGLRPGVALVIGQRITLSE